LFRLKSECTQVDPDSQLQLELDLRAEELLVVGMLVAGLAAVATAVAVVVVDAAD